MSRTAQRVLIGFLCTVGAAGGLATAVQLSRPVPAPAVRVDGVAPDTSFVTPRAVTLPPQGSLALEADGGQSVAALAESAIRPIGSVAKTMTALVVLEAHPLIDARDQGPTLTMTQADVAIYQTTLAEDGSSLAVVAGERMTERDLLLALMLPSANNIAETLGIWVSGGTAPFVARLNARAAQMGMASTHFADPSGFDAGTVSSSADLVKLGRAALANPALADVAATRVATLPDGTTVENLDALLDSETGWLGIKTGETPAAGGCLLFAVRRSIPGGADAVTLVGAVLGQTDLTAAFDAARTAVATAYEGYTEVVWGSHPPSIRGEITAAWGGTAGVRLGAARGTPSSALRSHSRVTLRIDPQAPAAPIEPGSAVAIVHALVDGREAASWEVDSAGRIDGAPVPWHIMHG